MIRTVSLKTALKLKEAGWTKETHLFHFKSPLPRIEDKINAPNTDELLEELSDLNIRIERINNCWIIESHQINYVESNMDLCEGLARLYLKKEGLLNAK